MTIRGSFRSSHGSRKRRGRGRVRPRLGARGTLQLERLEERQLLAGLFQLAGVQPNEGALLEPAPGQSNLTVAPTELTFQFTSAAQIDPASLAGAIRITRSGLDGQFERASVASDFNTKGAVVIALTAVEAGPGGNNISLVVTKRDMGAGAAPAITVLGTTIAAELNTNAVGRTTALALVNAINSHLEASTLVQAAIISGSGAVDIATPATIYSPLNLAGANAAKATSNFNSATPLQVLFTAAQPGSSGNTISIVVTKSNHGGADAPKITVVGNTITADLNTNVADPSTAQDLVDAINNHPAASALVTASIVFGDPNTNIAGTAVATTLTLSGTHDVEVEPGYLGLGDSPRQVVFRFKEALVDDVYRIDVLGSGPTPLMTVDGDRFNEGRDQSLLFDLNLGPQVLAVVPQPIVRSASGVLQQQANRIDVYFNNDDLNAASAQNPAFYQLIYTKETVENTDDQRFNPTAVVYYPDRDMATLTFGQAPSIEQLAGPGTYRLRIGTDEAIPPAPFPAISPAADPGSSYATALNLGALGARSRLINEAIDAQPYNLQFPGDNEEPGHRETPDEVQNHYVGAADSTEGITTQFYNFQSVYGFDPYGNYLLNQITPIQKERAREIFEVYGEYLGVQFVETADLGFTIVTGDLRAIQPDVPTGPGGVISIAGPTLTPDGFIFLANVAIMDRQDFSAALDDQFGDDWYQTAMHEIGHLLGIGHTYELPPPTVMGDEPALAVDNPVEPIYPSDQDIVHGQYLHRPESKDIDLYKFQVQVSGVFSAETIAERQPNASLLDTALALYKEVQGAGGSVARELVARNDDYFSNDSFLEIKLEPGTYFVGVTASGNDQYDPGIEDSGLGGVTQGEYQLRLDFRPSNFSSIVDQTGQRLDGDGDGAAGGVFDFWFRAVTSPIIVDKSHKPVGGQPLGTLANPYNNIAQALAAAKSGDVVRIVGNGGADGDITTLGDNLAYEIGYSRLGSALADGSTMNVPRGVTVMIDSGAIFKLRRSRIGAGSSSVSIDRSAGALQVLGVPRLFDAAGKVLKDQRGEVIAGSVYFTSAHDRQVGRGTNPDSSPPPAAPGDWGGLEFRSDLDKADANRLDYEAKGVFLNYVNQADIRYGGGNVVIDGVSQVITPIHMTDARPTVSYNTITFSADAAMSASPNSFEETNFHAPRYQTIPFTSDYDRVGPDIHGNTVIDNATNGLFVRVRTPAGGDLQKLTVPGRWDDADIVHLVGETLTVDGTPGGPLLEATVPPATLVVLTALDLTPDPATPLDPGGTYNYCITYVDASGNESQPSDATRDERLAAGEDAIRLTNLPRAAAGFVARRIYRSDNTGNRNGLYTLVAQINATDTSYLDNGSTVGGVLNTPPALLRARLNARLAIDPGVVVKSVVIRGGARIDAEFGANLIAEGTDGKEVIFTSAYDDRYGAGGTFDTNHDDGAAVETAPAPGDWGGIFIGPMGRASIDHAVIAYGGGVSGIEGDFAGFNVLEIHQADARIANSVLEFNAKGLGGQAPADRFGRGFNEEGTIFVRGAQPIIVGNIIRDNDGPAVNVDVNSLNHLLVSDYGRSTGPVDLADAPDGNQGPLVRGNRLANNGLNGMEVRGATLTTQSVWDDTDIVHIVFDTIYVPDFHTYGGLRLESNPGESLVVKLMGPNAGFTATGQALDIDDRIGGAIDIIGQPGSPVVLTSLTDATVGAGLDPQGRPQNDTSNDGLPARTAPSGAFNIQLNMGPALLANPAAIAAFQAAEMIWESILEDPVTVSIDAEFGALPAGIPGGAMPEFAPFSYDQVLQAMMADARPHETIVSQLPSFTDLSVLLPSDPTNPFTVSQTMNLTRANAKALGLPGIPTTPSVFNPTQNIDGTMTFNNLYAAMFDYDRSDGIGAGLYDFVAVVVHEIGHVLGFVSSGDDVDFDLFAGPPPTGPVRDIELTPLDLFRVEPGDSRTTDFTHTPRVLDPALTAVLYDGGHFAPTGIPIAGLRRGDVPMSTGVYFGDGWQASHFKDDNLIAGIFLGMMDPFLAPAGTRQDLTIVDKRAFDVIGWDVAETGAPGDWRSIRLDEYSNDRNVQVVTELESPQLTAPGSNATAGNAQFLGELAPTEKAGDDNRRLGFEVHGVLNEPGDVDVYSFRADAGTEVWFDIDRTSQSLDTVIELVDADGVAMALSDHSVDGDQQSLSAVIPDNHVNPLQKSLFEPLDRWTTNPRDAGMRVVLPGEPGTTNLYHVRIRSSNVGPGDPQSDLQDPAKLLDGITHGAYQLQIRLRELDEIPGSNVYYADIRYATNGVEVFGQPSHSPLLGEAAEDTTPNDSTASAQPLGNVLTTDRGTLGVAGFLDSTSDVDVYQFDVNYSSVQSSLSDIFGSGVHHAAVSFDVDYADGTGGPDTQLFVFDASGRLILTARDSNIADDRPAALEGADFDDLSRGSSGVLDPFLGSVELPEGTYYVAVANNTQMAEELNQFYEANPANSLVRLEPVNGYQRIAEDRIGSSGGSQIVDSPQIPVLFDSATSPQEFTLSDVTLFVSQNYGFTGTNRGNVVTVDAYGGGVETTLGQFQPPVGDIAMRDDGNLFAFTIGPRNPNNPHNDANVAWYLQLDTGTALDTEIGNFTAMTIEQDPTTPTGTIISPTGGSSTGVGLDFNAMAYSGGSYQWTGYAIGSRGDAEQENGTVYTPSGAYGVSYTRNILYIFNINTGLGQRDPPTLLSGVAALAGAGTDVVARGHVASLTRITPSGVNVGDIFMITVGGETISYIAQQPTAADVAAGLAAAWNKAAQTSSRFAAFDVLTSFGALDELFVRLRDPAGASLPIIASTGDGGGGNFQRLTPVGFGPGGNVTGMAFLGGQLYAVTDQGGLYSVQSFGGGGAGGNIGTYIPSSANDLLTAGAFNSHTQTVGPIEFAGLAAGPSDIEGGRYANLLFGITENGRIYAFDTNGVLQPVFANGATYVDTGLSSVSGLAFSTLDRNLWNTTSNRGPDLGHGIEPAWDGSRTISGVARVEGGTSFYFGNDRDNSTGGNNAYSNQFVRDYNFPGGAHGSLVSNPFSLAGYSFDDQPMLYFNYYLETENTNYDPGPNPDNMMRDSFRVYVVQESGEETLVATNDSYQDVFRWDEFDIGLNDTVSGYPMWDNAPSVQELFDNTGGWRQARIPLARFAGQSDLRLRFDFSTAGSMGIGDITSTGEELRGVEGVLLRDGQTFTVDFANTFEIDLGYTLVAPTGGALVDGGAFTVDDGVNAPVTFEFDQDNFFARDILASDGSQFSDGQSFQVRDGVNPAPVVFEFESGYNLHVPAAGAGPGGIADGETFVMNEGLGGPDVVFEFDLDGNTAPGNTPIGVNNVAFQVPASGAGPGGIADGNVFTINDGLGGPNVVFEFDRDGNTTPGNTRVNVSNIVLQVPATGGGPGGVADGDWFAVNDGQGGADVVFEFDSNGSATPGNRAIAFTASSTQDQIADAMVAALQAAGLGLNPANAGGGRVRLGVINHVVDTTGAPTLGQSVSPSTQSEAADQIVAAIAAAAIGLTPQHMGAGLVRLGVTTHVVDASGTPAIVQSVVPSTQNEVANQIVVAVQNAGLGLTPFNAGGGVVNLGGVNHTLDTSGSPNLAQSGLPGLANPSAVPVRFAPSASVTADQMAAAIAAALNGAGVPAVAAGRVVDLVNANASFSPGDTALAPAGVDVVIPLDAGQTPGQVAGGIEQAVAASGLGVVAHHNDNRVNLEGAVAVSGTGLPASFIDGAPGVSPLNFPVFAHSGMSEAEVAQAVADAMAASFAEFRLQILADNGAQISEGDSFTISDRFQTVNFEFDEGYTIQVPAAAAAIVDGNTFFINDGLGGSDVVFEFDSNGIADPANRPVDISPKLSLVVPAAGSTLPGGVADGGTFFINNGAGSGNVVFEFDNNGVTAPGNRVVLINDILYVFVPFAGGGPGGVSDGQTFFINRGLGGPDVVFEFNSNTVTTPGNIIINFNSLTTQDQLAALIVNAVQNAGLGLTPAYLGGGLIRMDGLTPLHVVNLAGTPTMWRFTTPLTGDDVANRIVPVVQNAGLGLTPVNIGSGEVLLVGATPRYTLDTSGTPNLQRRVTPATQDSIANAIVAAIQNAALGLTPTNLGGGLIHVGGTTHILNTSGTPALIQSGQPGTTDPNAVAIPFMSSMTLSADEIANRIAAAVNSANANLGLDVTASMASPRRVNLVGDRVTVNLGGAPALSVQDPSAAAKTDGELIRVVGHQVTNPGPLGWEASLAGDEFGAFYASGPPNVATLPGIQSGYPGSQRGMDNTYEGAYIDDVIIGFAERGEMVINAGANSNIVANMELLNPDLPPPGQLQITEGAYQLEIRRSSDYGYSDPPPIPDIYLTRSFDTNDRLGQQVQIVAPPGSAIAESQTFALYDGLDRLTFEFDDVTIGDGVAPGNVAIPFDPSDDEYAITRRIRDAINTSAVQAVLDITAATGDGLAAGPSGTSGVVNLFGSAIVELAEGAGLGVTGQINDGMTLFSDSVFGFANSSVAGESITSITISVPAGFGFYEFGGWFPPMVNPLSDPVGYSFTLVDGSPNLTIDFTDFDPGEQFIFGSLVLDNIFWIIAYGADLVGSTVSVTFDSGRVVSSTFVDDQIAGNGVAAILGLQGISSVAYDELGDQNLFRDQGQILIESNRIEHCSGFGVVVGSGPRDVPEETPHAGPPRNLRELNQLRWTPGVTITNNVVAFNGVGGIRLSGEVNGAGQQLASVPVGRVVNNTIYGGGVNDVGVLVQNNASPTLLNNIIAGLQTGISVSADSQSTVISGTVYQGNGVNSNVGLGALPIVLRASDPLFAGLSTGNFYPADGSRVIDTAVPSLLDRSALVQVRNPLGIPVSPILAPDRDQLGQTRPDPNVGQGANVFKDRGAIERADFIGPTAIMLDPRDNGVLDQNPAETVVQVSGTVFTGFSIQLVDGVAPADPLQGAGIDDASVSRYNVLLFQEGRLLEEGVDYSFSYEPTNNIIRLTPLAGIFQADTVYVVQLVNVDAFLITAPDGSLVSDGSSFDITDAVGGSATVEFDSGYSVQVPQALTIHVPAAAGGPGGIADGGTFTISNGVQTVTFEFDRNNVSVAGNKVITYSPRSTLNELTAAITAALNTANLGLSAVDLGGGDVHVGSSANHVLNTVGSSLTQSGVAEAVSNGQTFTIDDGSKLVRFQFVKGGGAASGNVAIPFTAANTHEQIADAIAAAVRGAGLGLNPTHFGDGKVHIGGQWQYKLDVSASSLIPSGQAGVRPAFGIQLPTSGGKLFGLTDGQTFTVANGTTAVTFEFDSDGRSFAGYTRIPFSASTSVDQLANTIVTTIRNAGLGLFPTNLGFGAIRLGGTTSHSVNLANSTLTQRGQPGVPAAIAAQFLPDVSFTGEQMAASIAAAINSSSLTNVQATVRGRLVIIEGAASVTGIALDAVKGVQDLAGNLLKPNQPNGETLFQIFTGPGLDFGDAPDPPYPTMEDIGGARHIVVQGYSLGATVDVDLDGQPTPNADGDGADDDGVRFDTPVTGSFTATITVTATGVTASRPALLDAWIDFNRNGVWEASEQIFASEPLAAGDTVLQFQAPGGAVAGTTFARFRMSSAGGLAPTGEAADGEVEDYAVTIVGNPWRNPVNPVDVNADGYVSAVDALSVINRLNLGWGDVPLPPARPPGERFVDVNGDSWITAIDALMVINRLNLLALAGGEGESVSSFVVQSPVAVSQGAVAASTLAATPSAGGVGTIITAPLQSAIAISSAPSTAASGQGSREGKQQASADSSAGSARYWVSPPLDLQLRNVAEAPSLLSSTMSEELEGLLDGIAEDAGRAGNWASAHDAVLAELDFSE